MASIEQVLVLSRDVRCLPHGQNDSFQISNSSGLDRLSRLLAYCEKLGLALVDVGLPPWSPSGVLLFKKLVFPKQLTPEENCLLGSLLIQLRKRYNFCALFVKTLECSRITNLSSLYQEFGYAFAAGLVSFMYEVSAKRKANDAGLIQLCLDGLQLYAPVAEALGLRVLQSEMEDVCFSVLNPEARGAVMTVLSNLERAHGLVVAEVSANLSGKLALQGIKHRMCWRRKTPYSIWFKMLSRQKSLESGLSDLVAFRVIVPAVESCYKVLELVHSEYKAIPGSFEDFISFPKANGYRSIHTIVAGPCGYKVEIQIRTEQMHMFAEHGIASHWLYKKNLYESLGSKSGICESYSKRIFK